MTNTILLVDDESIILNALTRALGKEDYSILSASNGEEALRILSENEVQVVITDQRMPKMTGSELIKEIKQFHPDVVTMMLSSYADFDVIKDAINEGHIYKFLSKPWDNVLLKEQIREAIAYYNSRQKNELNKNDNVYSDKLTGLPDRAFMINALMSLAEECRGSQSILAAIVVDVDRFTGINNRFGYHIGNQILKAISEKLKKWAEKDYVVGRMGSDEFAIIVPGVSQINQLKMIVSKLESTLKEPLHVSERELYITCSVGVSLYPQDCERTDMLFEKALIAASASKTMGGGMLQYFDKGMENEDSINLFLESEIHRALDEEQFVNYYQPIISLETQKIIGVEALLRWQHPLRGLLMPSQFLPVCESTGLILPIDRSVLRRSIQDFLAFSAEGFDNLYISSNFSTRHFMTSGLTELVSGMLDLTSISPQYITIEVTESLLVQNEDSVLRVLQSLHNLGVKLALDDFGTGYASLSYLKKYPFDILKIDKSYTREIGVSKNDEVLISSMINMANSLGQKVVAEGIETQQQLDFLMQTGCHFGQGFLFSKPLSYAQMLKFLSEEHIFKTQSG